MFLMFNHIKNYIIFIENVDMKAHAKANIIKNKDNITIININIGNDNLIFFLLLIKVIIKTNKEIN